jgi:hypothetical protein
MFASAWVLYKSKHNLAIALRLIGRSHFSISLVGVIQSDRILFRTKVKPLRRVRLFSIAIPKGIVQSKLAKVE